MIAQERFVARTGLSVAASVLAMSLVAGAATIVAGTSVAFANSSRPPLSPSRRSLLVKAARPAKAGKAQSDQAPAKLDAAAAQQQVEAGINALEAGKLDNAAAALSAGLGAGSLPAGQTARALYYRGITYRRQNKPALAISDFTSALWLKGGLSEQQRADALQNRSAAYREAGLPDQAPGRWRPGRRSASAACSGAVEGCIATRADGGDPVSTGSGARCQTASAGSRGSCSRASARTDRADQSEFVAVVSAGCSDRGSAAVRRRAQPPAKPAASRSWSSGTQVHTTAGRRSAATAAGRAGAAAAPAQGAASRGADRRCCRAAAAAPHRPLLLSAATSDYQVAAVRSAEEAQTIAAGLQSRYGRELAGRAPTIDQTVMGNMGTFYRVRIGPFASGTDGRALCDRLKTDGLSCLAGP